MGWFISLILLIAGLVVKEPLLVVASSIFGLGGSIEFTFRKNDKGE